MQYLKKTLLLLIFVISAPVFACAQSDEFDSLWISFNKFYNSGSYHEADSVMQLSLRPEMNISPLYYPYVYSNLGIVNFLLSRFGTALNYYNLAEQSVKTKSDTARYLGDIYINKAILYMNENSLSESMNYYEKGIRLIERQPIGKDNARNYAQAFYNKGILYYMKNDYKNSIECSWKSYNLKTKYNINDKWYEYQGIARCYAKMGEYSKSEQYFLRSIELMISENDPYFTRLAELYYGYSELLQAEKRNRESIAVLNRALEICRMKYGEKNSLTSKSFKMIGDSYKNMGSYDSALVFYQKSLVALSPGFNNMDLTTNPPADSSLFDVRMLDNLKYKALTLALSAKSASDTNTATAKLENSLATIKLAQGLIDKIKSGYSDEEKSVYMAANEKDTWLAGIDIAESLWKLTGRRELVTTMYSFAQKAKASVLENETFMKDILLSPSIPDSVRSRLEIVRRKINELNKIILDESQKSKPDKQLLARLPDDIFQLQREAQTINEGIYSSVPGLREMLTKIKPVDPREIIKQLPAGQAVIDYFVSNTYENGERKLYTFIITKQGINFLGSSVDSSFSSNAKIIREANSPAMARNSNPESTGSYIRALRQMYLALFEPVKGMIKDNRIVIIPDEEIAWLPFEAFLVSEPDYGKLSFNGLKYLLTDYSISYAYASSFIFSKHKKLPWRDQVIAFSPAYKDSTFAGVAYHRLKGAGEEISSILKYFKGYEMPENEAIESTFLKAVSKHSILHLAMHSVADTTDPRFSYLYFDTRNDSASDGRLYNYEIELLDVKSPMVVLSSCNSVTGSLFHGEGLMSLARGFILAGAGSVIGTTWEVNDQASSVIIGDFYKYLAEGMSKDRAMQLAKMSYLRNTSPGFTTPYYWAAYEVLGDTTPVAGRRPPYYLVLIIVPIGLLAIYFRRRRIRSQRPE